jgi:hypothetical protein
VNYLASEQAQPFAQVQAGAHPHGSPQAQRATGVVPHPHDVFSHWQGF